VINVFLGLEKKLVSLKDLENQLIAQGMSPLERVDVLKEQEQLLSHSYGKPSQTSKKPEKIIKSGKVMLDFDKVGLICVPIYWRGSIILYIESF